MGVGWDWRKLAGTPEVLLYALLGLFSGVAVTACSDDAPLGLMAGGLTVMPEVATVEEGGEIRLSAEGAPAGVIIQWVASPSEVATVNAEGLVIGKKVGTAVIRATAGSFQDSAVVHVQSASHPRDADGFSVIAEHDFSCLPGNRCGEHGNWSHRESRDFAIVHDRSAPESPGGVLRGRFPRNFAAGRSPWRFDAWASGSGRGKYKEYDEIYISFWMKIDGKDYQNEATGTKIIYVAYGSTNRINHSCFFVRGNGQSGAVMNAMDLHYFMSEMTSEGSDPGGGAKAHAPNVNRTKKFKVGDWHHIELWMKINDLDDANGEVKWWLDGHLLAHHKGKRFRSSQHPRAFYYMTFTPVWGGTIGARTRDDSWRIDHLYIAGKRNAAMNRGQQGG